MKSKKKNKCRSAPEFPLPGVTLAGVEGVFLFLFIFIFEARVFLRFVSLLSLITGEDSVPMRRIIVPDESKPDVGE